MAWWWVDLDNRSVTEPRQHDSQHDLTWKWVEEREASGVGDILEGGGGGGGGSLGEVMKTMAVELSGGLTSIVFHPSTNQSVNSYGPGGQHLVNKSVAPSSGGGNWS